MTRPLPRTVEIPRSESADYLQKAVEFLLGAKRGLTDDRPNGAALEAIHASISACDALTIWHLRKKARGADHLEVLRLLHEVPNVAESKIERQVLEVLSIKGSVEYGGAGVTESRARKIVTQAERIVEWARDSISP